MATRLGVGERDRWRWYHALVFYAVVQLLSFGLARVAGGARGRRDRTYFRALTQTIVTPPAWVFGPAWTLNNLGALWGGLRALNTPPGTPGRDAYLALQAASWLDFALFNAAYFALRSPLNALALTLAYFSLTVASGLVAAFGLRDRKAAAALAPTFAWLLVALPAATGQALWNRDAYYGVGPLLPPNATLARRAR